MRQVVKETHNEEFEIEGRVIQPSKYSIMEAYWDNSGQYVALLQVSEIGQPDTAIVLEQADVETILFVLQEVHKNLSAKNNPKELAN
jgi:hypothetical protein